LVPPNFLSGFVVRNEDGSKVWATRFRNVLSYSPDIPETSDQITEILLSGGTFVVGSRFMRPWERRGWPNQDWMGSWRLEKFAVISNEPIFQMRTGDDLHECELRIPDFNNHQSLIQQELGPIFLRYHNYGPLNKWTGEPYIDAYRWAQKDAKLNLQKALSDKENWIKGLNDLVDDFMSSSLFPASGRIVVITAPLGMPGREKNEHREHLGYCIGESVAKQITANNFLVEHVMAFDLYENTFPYKKQSTSWKQKAKMKQGKWVDEPKNDSRNKIAQADLVIIVDDTMISYATQLRIAITVREYNTKCGILCAGVFAITGNRWGNTVSDTPDDIYKVLRSK